MCLDAVVNSCQSCDRLHYLLEGTWLVLDFTWPRVMEGPSRALN
jgi:hypothetical protein